MKWYVLICQAKSSEDGSDGFLSKVRMLFGMDGGSKGAEKLSFPYMRQFLKSIYAAQNLSITGIISDCLNDDVLALKYNAINYFMFVCMYVCMYVLVCIFGFSFQD